jgi:hypothetical protein
LRRAVQLATRGVVLDDEIVCYALHGLIFDQPTGAGEQRDGRLPLWATFHFADRLPIPGVSLAREGPTPDRVYEVFR